MSPSTTTHSSSRLKIWWSATLFIVGVHIATIIGVYLQPPSVAKRASVLLSLIVWQFSGFGITIGYHRLYAHKAFRASFGLRVILAILGASACQGSIKWWCLRHRLHHRFTDDPEHDPYAATRGFFYSHIGWIFIKRKHERMNLIERDDLNDDPVVRFQHKYCSSLALFFGFVIPTMLGYLWGDMTGSFVWGGLVSKVITWHCTFLVNSLAHWDGLQPYSDENTSKGNLLVALLTCGEGNHNFHAFPHDFRSGPSLVNWDPSKWIIMGLSRAGLITGLRRAEEIDIHEAKKHMVLKAGGTVTPDDDDSWNGPTWSLKEVDDYIKGQACRCVVIIDGFAVDATPYLKDHPGGARLLRKYSGMTTGGLDANEAFNGGLNTHSRAAKRMMRKMRFARIEGH